MVTFGLLLLLMPGAAPGMPPPSASCFLQALGIDEFRCQWYCKHYRAFGEGALPRGTEAYRFVYLRSFDQPIAVRVHRIENRWLLSAAVLSGKGGYEPGHVVHRVNRELSPAEIAFLQRRLRGADFWGEPWVNDTDTGLDGARWILEGRLGAQYRLLDIWSPSSLHYRLYRELCLFFLDIASLRPADDDLY